MDEVSKIARRIRIYALTAAFVVGMALVAWQAMAQPVGSGCTTTLDGQHLGDCPTTSTATAGSNVGVDTKVAPTVAQAQYDQKVLDTVLKNIKTTLKSGQSKILGYAQRIFWALATIEVIVAGARVMLMNRDLGDFLTDVINSIFFIGFFWAVLLHGGEWIDLTIKSFLQAGQAVGGINTDAGPTALLIAAMDVGEKCLDKMSIGSPLQAVFIAIAAMVSIIILSLIAAWIVVTLVESYFVTSATVIMLGFGGSRWTKNYALQVVSYAISVGVKLLVLELIAGTSMVVLTQYINAPTLTGPLMVQLVVTCIVLGAVAYSVPQITQSAMLGASFTSGAALFAASGAGGRAAASVAKGIFGTGQVANAARQTASITAQQARAGGTGRASAMAKGLRTAAGSVAGAAVKDLGRKLSGVRQFTTPGSRMAADMRGYDPNVRNDLKTPEQQKREDKARQTLGKGDMAVKPPTDGHDPKKPKE